MVDDLGSRNLETGGERISVILTFTPKGRQQRMGVYMDTRDQRIC